MSPVRGGRCVIVSMERVSPGGTRYVNHARHRSTGPDIDSSRFVAVHICDQCGALFSPTDPMGEYAIAGVEDGADVVDGGGS